MNLLRARGLSITQVGTTAPRRGGRRRSTVVLVALTLVALIVLVPATAFATLVDYSAQPWPMDGQNGFRNHISPYVGAQAGGLVWKAAGVGTLSAPMR